MKKIPKLSLLCLIPMAGINMVECLHVRTVQENRIILNAETLFIARLLSSDTLIVDKQAAVFIEPDSLRIEERKREIGEENFYTETDDYLYYTNRAREFLDSVKLTVLNAKGKKFIKFVRSDKTQQIINIKKLPDLWSIYFFDPKEKAKQVDITSIDEEYKIYFK